MKIFRLLVHSLKWLLQPELSWSNVRSQKICPVLPNKYRVPRLYIWEVVLKLKAVTLNLEENFSQTEKPDQGIRKTEDPSSGTEGSYPLSLPSYYPSSCLSPSPLGEEFTESQGSLVWGAQAPAFSPSPSCSRVGFHHPSDPTWKGSAPFGASQGSAQLAPGVPGMTIFSIVPWRTIPCSRGWA